MVYTVNTCENNQCVHSMTKLAMNSLIFLQFLVLPQVPLAQVDPWHPATPCFLAHQDHPRND